MQTIDENCNLLLLFLSHPIDCKTVKHKYPTFKEKKVSLDYFLMLMTGHDSKAIQERGERLNQQRKRKKNDVLKYEEAKRHLILSKYS